MNGQFKSEGNKGLRSLGFKQSPKKVVPQRQQVVEDNAGFVAPPPVASPPVASPRGSSKTERFLQGLSYIGHSIANATRRAKHGLGHFFTRNRPITQEQQGRPITEREFQSLIALTESTINVFINNDVEEEAFTKGKVYEATHKLFMDDHYFEVECDDKSIFRLDVKSAEEFNNYFRVSDFENSGTKENEEDIPARPIQHSEFITLANETQLQVLFSRKYLEENAIPFHDSYQIINSDFTVKLNKIYNAMYSKNELYLYDENNTKINFHLNNSDNFNTYFRLESSIQLPGYYKDSQSHRKAPAPPPPLAPSQQQKPPEPFNIDKLVPNQRICVKVRKPLEGLDMETPYCGILKHKQLQILHQDSSISVHNFLDKKDFNNKFIHTETLELQGGRRRRITRKRIHHRRRQQTRNQRRRCTR